MVDEPGDPGNGVAFFVAGIGSDALVF
ncbi:hypothetical protein G9274_002605 [Stenotrophomonas rhizophila]|nr:hypothetical protein G9274_002605 [Stenotrophomonas rhizophila]